MHTPALRAAPMLACAQLLLASASQAQVCTLPDAYEPNETCAAAAQLVLPSPSGADGLLLFEELTLPVGDVDEFTIDVPSGTTYEVVVWTQAPSPGPSENLLSLSSTRGSACGGTRLESAVPVTPPGFPGPPVTPVDSSRRIPLMNGTDATLRYTVRVEQMFAANCVSYALRVDDRTEHYAALLDEERYPNLGHDSCADPAPVPENVGVNVNLAPGRATYIESRLSAGETMRILLDPVQLAIGGVPLKVELHDGDAPCAIGTPPLLSATFYPGDDWPELLYGNDGTSTQQVLTRISQLPGPHAVSQQNVLFTTRSRSGFISSSCVGHSLLTGVCPCDNPSVSLHEEGCRNSTGVGAVLDANGSPRVLADDLLLSLRGLPAGTVGVLFHQTSGGVPPSTAPFFDGMWCLSRAASALHTISADATGMWSTSAPLASDVGASPHTHSILQAWYRDGDGPCGTGSNTTNTVWVSWR